MNKFYKLQAARFSEKNLNRIEDYQNISFKIKCSKNMNYFENGFLRITKISKFFKKGLKISRFIKFKVS